MSIVIILIVVGVLLYYKLGSKSDSYENTSAASPETAEITESEQLETLSSDVQTDMDMVIKAYEKEETQKKVLSPKEKKEKKLKDKAKMLFCDAQPSIKDFSHLTEEEAERKLERIKERDGWVEDDVYSGLMKIIRGDYPIMDIPDDLSADEPEKVFAWFKKEKEENNNSFSNDVWKFICNVLKPYHEAELLQELVNVDAAELEKWMEKKKSEGKFFSNKVYSRMRSKWLKQYGL